ncbi:DUF1905 domain-containing protein [Petropleomorpha daqingensis]|uniref:Uncharacterized protein n=1 Tax=Petropleomorpha daqingensis TaxID=2026353 RepID=A0A853CLI4_9ACTN|nr:hypothetical protein [Petropleomorpha daqingensis]
MDVAFTAEVWHWGGGPPPFCFVTVPDDESRHLHAVVAAVTYGWGMVPVRADAGATVTVELSVDDGRWR